MRLTLRQKQNFYYELGQLLRSGMPLPRAVENLAQQMRGDARRFLNGLQTEMLRGATLADALLRQPRALSEMEMSIVAACERSGRLVEGCAYLSNYFGALERARVTLIRKSLYPAFILHFGVFLLALPPAIAGGGLIGYAKQTIGFLLALYAVGAICAVVAIAMQKAARTNTIIDSLLQTIPPFGKLRRMFVFARFCATYEIQLQSGINVIDSITSAAAASQSARVREAVQNAVPKIRAGSQVSGLLADSQVFPRDLIRGLQVGEESGEIDRELLRLAAYYETEAIARLEMLSVGIARAIYVVILLYLGFQIVETFRSYLGGLTKIIDGMNSG